MKDTYIFAIPEGKTVIGRENAMRDYLEKRTFISRSHGIITNNKGVVYYEDTSKNGSVLNGNRVTQRIRLTNGDKLYLGHRCDVADNDTSKAAYFVFCL